MSPTQNGIFDSRAPHKRYAVYIHTGRLESKSTFLNGQELRGQPQKGWSPIFVPAVGEYCSNEYAIASLVQGHYGPNSN